MAARGYEVIFGKHRCLIQRNSDKRIHISENQGGQYVLKQSGEVYVAQNRLKLCVHDWQRILGHRDIRVVKPLNDRRFVSGVTFDACKSSDGCEVRAYIKMTRLPLPKKSATSTIAVMDLVHTDLCGLMLTKSHGGMRYILTIHLLMTFTHDTP